MRVARLPPVNVRHLRVRRRRLATAAASARAKALSAQQLVVRHVTDLPRGVADHDGPGRDVAEYDRARPDECLLTDLDPRQQHRSAATRAPRRIVGPRRSACRFSVRPM